ncbi:hypothetical protein CC85DRAFT_330749 [Cutaneotrichosporon oleaginosum]|uniref:Uncharacterized protein n=1 Tax=Cutaneotrichosporon oleaginosum TaxID=879819 RepID=A0A0J0XEG1_9TREE|nr:uncharacterized protein CC85DRAFT_330749 [Cutaneotrichosporon oleaginosum]KLT39438.1 hypothetical protein CC85DRAFT_330749 [Cutaneotrichosporon oleaginosum]TXT08444.1 hypothetical protein COLE_05368 [Cutaneotrichosporon oleaginosum]
MPGPPPAPPPPQLPPPRSSHSPPPSRPSRTSPPRPPPSLRPTTLQRATLALVAVLTATMIAANATLLAPLYFMSWRFGPIKDTWRPLLVAHILYGVVLLSYLSAFALAARRGGWRVREDVLPTGLLSATGFVLAGMYTIVPLYSGLTIQEWECEGLGVPCGATRISLAITWPIAALCGSVCVGETVYVLRRHGRGVWHHTLPFLQAVPPEDLVDARIYSALPEAPQGATMFPMYGLPLEGRGGAVSGAEGLEARSWDVYRVALFGTRDPEGARKPLRGSRGRRSPPE